MEPRSLPSGETLIVGVPKENGVDEDEVGAVAVVDMIWYREDPHGWLLSWCFFFPEYLTAVWDQHVICMTVRRHLRLPDGYGTRRLPRFGPPA